MKGTLIRSRGLSDSGFKTQNWDMRQSLVNLRLFMTKVDTVDSRYLEIEGTIINTSRYPYFDISDL